MSFDPRKNKFLHSPGGMPAPSAPTAPHMTPMPGRKPTSPHPGRWDRLQQYLERPAAPIAPVKGDGEEPV